MANKKTQNAAYKFFKLYENVKKSKKIIINSEKKILHLVYENSFNFEI